MGLHERNLRLLARRGSASMLFGLQSVLDVIYNLGVCDLLFDHNALKDICFWVQ
jgi:hypothetical protein